MKKIIITIVLFLGLAIPASAFYYDNALVNLWNSRRDLQKAFPGDPSHNTKLEAWAKKYGWKETPDLYNYYPDKAIVEKIVEVKTNDRIAALERQVAALTSQISQLQAGQSVPSEQTTIIQQSEPTGVWRECTTGERDEVFCGMTTEEKRIYKSDRFKLLFYTKYE